MKYAIIQLVAAAGIVLVCGVAAGATEIKIRERAECGSSVVRLGDVAEIADSDRSRTKALAALPLMPAPAPGTQRFLRQREIQDLLAAHGEDVGQLRFAGHAQVAVAVAHEVKPTAAEAVSVASARREAFSSGRAVRQAPAPAIEAAAAHELDQYCCRLIAEHLAAAAGNAGAWRVTCQIPERHLILLQSATSTPKCMGGDEPWTGRQRFVITFDTARGTSQVPVSAEVTLATPVVVAVRPIARGETITAAHVALRTTDNAPRGTVTRTPATEVEPLIGMEAQQAIRAGEMVYVDQVRAPLVVKRGEIINVTSRAGGIRVRTTARARQDGARGDLIQVETLETRERFDVRVVATREAAVFAATPPRSPMREQMTDTARRAR